MEKSPETKENPKYQNDFAPNNDLLYDAKIQYRLLRRRVSSYFRKRRKQKFINILLVTTKKTPTAFIQATKKQYPDKNISVLIPMYGVYEECDKVSHVYDFDIQNKTYTAQLYKYKSNSDNIDIFGIYSPAFSELTDESDFSDIKYLSPFMKCARFFANKLKPDVIHSDYIPFFLGAEFEKQNFRNKYPIPVFQTVENISNRQCLEPFWAILNIADKKAMKKLCRDKDIQASVASLFSLRNIDNFKNLRDCLELIYQNYTTFRENYSDGNNVDENIFFGRLNNRVVKMFPQIFCGKKFFHPMLYSMKQAEYIGFLSETYYNNILKEVKNLKYKTGSITYAYEKSDNSIEAPFDVNNFREKRGLNKKYLLKEFSLDRIRTKFTDINLFDSDEAEVCGYLNSLYESPLILCVLPHGSTRDSQNIAIHTILKLFEMNKNFQVIFNIPKGFSSNYLKSFVDFCEDKTTLNGRWAFVDGELNLPRFMAAADFILLPEAENRCTNIQLMALNYGCIPVVNRRNPLFNDTIKDIFDDMFYGTGFKTEDNDLETDEEKFVKVMIKALNFYSQNHSGWNSVIRNCLNTNTGWTFEDIEKYNEIYEEIA